jgi:predicted DNA-binding transcriptional regulator AlpA
MRMNGSKQMNDIPKLLTLEEACEVLKIGPATFYAEVRAGRLPMPVKITKGRSVWVASEIGQVIARKAQEPRTMFPAVLAA